MNPANISDDSRILTKKAQSDCDFLKRKLRLDDIYLQLDEFYFELKERLIELINQNNFEKDIEYFLIKMFKLDDEEVSEFNLIDYIKDLKSFNNELYEKHRVSCENDEIKNLQLKISSLNSKIKKLQEDNDAYKSKLDRVISDISKYNLNNNLQFDNLNINFNSNPYYNSHSGLLISDLCTDSLKKGSNMNTSRSQLMMMKTKSTKPKTEVSNLNKSISNRKQIKYSTSSIGSMGSLGNTLNVSNYQNKTLNHNKSQIDIISNSNYSYLNGKYTKISYKDNLKKERITTKESKSRIEMGSSISNKSFLKGNEKYIKKLDVKEGSNSKKNGVGESYFSYIKK